MYNINTSEGEEKMKKRIFIFLIISLLLFCGCEEVDKKTNTTSKLTSSKNLTVNSKISNTNFDDDFIEPQGETKLTEISSKKLKKIPKNTSYKKIFEVIGKGADFYNGNLAMYRIDKEKILALYFKKETDLCTYSGEELLEFAITPKTIEELGVDVSSGDGYIYGIVVYKDGGVSIYCPGNNMYYELGLSKAEMEFSDKSKAKKEDITLYGEVVVFYQEVLESFPAQVICEKVIILK